MQPPPSLRSTSSSSSRSLPRSRARSGTGSSTLLRRSPGTAAAVLAGALLLFGPLAAADRSAAQAPDVPSHTASDGVRASPDTLVDAPRDTLDLPSDAFLDESARTLFASARRRWLELDRAILSYEAEVRQRVRAVLRTPLKDRTMYRAEASSRVRWSADSTVVVQVLGARETVPSGTSAPGELPGIVDEAFDPTGDRLYFGLGGDYDGEGQEGEGQDQEEEEEEEAAEEGERAGAEEGSEEGEEEGAAGDGWIAHPIAPGSERHYRYRTGDTLRVSLGDGRSLRAVELQVVPRERSSRLLSGAVWIEPSSGSVVRGVYRLSRAVDLERDRELLDDEDDDPETWWIPGAFRPLELDVSLVTVEYSLWGFRYWMPHRLRMEGSARAGVLRMPVTYELSYRITDVVGAEPDAPPPPVEPVAAVIERWREDGAFEIVDDERFEGDGRHVLVPVDRERLHDSDVLPPPLGEDAPGFPTEGEVRAFSDRLSRLPLPSDVEGGGLELRWGPQRPDLIRYNRVEGLSVGARARLDVGALPVVDAVEAEGRLGLGSWVPDARLHLVRERPGYRWTLSGYHRVAEVDPAGRPLGLGSSLMALVFGRDDGDYFRATGARLRWEPTGHRRSWYRLELRAEEHAALDVSTDFSVAGLLGGDPDPFRPAFPAESLTEYAALVALEPWWGFDPRGAQGGVELSLEGAVGDREWVRARALARTALPLIGGARLGLEAGGGTSWGEPPPQREWLLGGARTLRGYPGAAARGTSFVRGRAEIARELSALRIAAFSDAAWAGPRGAFDVDDALVSAGVGASLLDGLVRLDLARALRTPTGWRLELYLDAVL